VDRQSIHIGAQPHRAGAIAAAEHAHHTRTIDEAVHLNPPAGEELCDDIRRAVGLQAELGMGMYVAADACEGGVIGAHSLERRAGGVSWGHSASFLSSLDAVSVEATIAAYYWESKGQDRSGVFEASA
jgi:hypothetical protein